MRQNKYVIAAIVMFSALFIIAGWKFAASRTSRSKPVLTRPCEPSDASGKSLRSETCRSGHSYFVGGRWTTCICSNK